MSQWFYIQQWRQAAWQRLLENRIVRVHWQVDEGIDQREILPQFVKLPSHVELTDEGICKYLTDTYDWCVYDWTVAHGDIDETRI